ncbi:MAG: HAMP domain-containing protein [Candidatus Ozemobacteraceae bacterium]
MNTNHSSTKGAPSSAPADTSSTAPSAFRKSYLILPSYQLRLTAFLILLLFIGSFVHGFFLYRITARGIEDGFLSAHNRLRSTWEILKPAVVLTDGLSFLLLSLSFGIAAVLISHRLVGPLFKIQGRVKELAEGRLDLPPVKLRKGDEGGALGEAVNSLQTTVRDRFLLVAALRNRVAGQTPPSSEEVVRELDRVLKDLSL